MSENKKIDLNAPIEIKNQANEQAPATNFKQLNDDMVATYNSLFNQLSGLTKHIPKVDIVDFDTQVENVAQAIPALPIDMVPPAVLQWNGKIKQKKSPLMPEAFIKPFTAKTTSPSGFDYLKNRNRVIKLGITEKNLSPSAQCLFCTCRFREHSNSVEKHCSCGGCAGFVSKSTAERINFTEFMRWCRRWVKANPNRTVDKFRKIWLRFQSIRHLSYCSGCDTPTFHNGLSPYAKRQDGLQCVTCFQCSSCCKCFQCKKCVRRRKASDCCVSCGICSNCCKCRYCPNCNRRCDFDYCGYARTDRQKRNNREGCGNCNTCCGCSDMRWVPFASFSEPEFYKPTLKQHTINPTSRFIATEIEVAGIRGFGKPIYEIVRKWKGGTVGDGSLPECGFEINSAPAGGDLYVNQVNEICAEIKKQDGFIDKNCGLHIHIDARDMNYYEIRRLVRVYATIEDALFTMVPADRIDGVIAPDGKLHQYCRPCGKSYLASIEQGKLPYEKVKADVISSVYEGTSTKDYRHRKRHTSRYNALNLHSWFYRGTIECRMFNGCIEPEPIISWGILWALIIDYAAKNSDEKIAEEMKGSSIECLLKLIGDNKRISDFIRSRVAFYSAQKKIEVKIAQPIPVPVMEEDFSPPDSNDDE